MDESLLALRLILEPLLALRLRDDDREAVQGEGSQQRHMLV